MASWRSFRNSIRGGVVVSGIRWGVVGEVFGIREGGSRRSFRNFRGEVVAGEGALGGRHSAGGHSPGGTHRGLLSGGALNGKHSVGDIQRGALHFSGGARPQNAPPWLRAWLPYHLRVLHPHIYAMIWLLRMPPFHGQIV